MWYTWTLLLVSCALVKADVAAAVEASEPVTVASTTLQPESESTTISITEDTHTTIDEVNLDHEETRSVATTRSPPLTLDRKAAELAWRSWLQSPESGNQNAPPRRIITKSLFITPLVCPKGQRLDRNGCVQVMTVNKDEHERILLEQLNALFSSGSSGDVLYDYGDDEPGPLQLSIPIGLDPQAAPLQSQEPSGQAQDLQPSYVKIDKKNNTTNGEISIEAELELLKLQHSQNNSATADGTDVLNHNVMNNLLALADKPKRDSPLDNSTQTNNTNEEGQKELVYGHVNVDPVLYGIENGNQQTQNREESTIHNKTLIVNDNDNTNTTNQELKTDLEGTKLNPENDYSDIGETIKLISRYAEVTTDDNFFKNQKKYAIKDDSILGTRTKLQHRRNRPKLDTLKDTAQAHVPSKVIHKDKLPLHATVSKNEPYYRYPWVGQHSPTPPPNYPFRHLQDYWPGRTQVGGVYNIHENPRRHHHSYPHYFKPRGYYVGNSGLYVGQDARVGPLQFYPHMVTQRHATPIQPHANNQDLYSLLGLRHWFSSEGTSKR